MTSVSLAREKAAAAGLFGDALRGALRPASRTKPFDLDRDLEGGRVIGPAACDHAIARRREAARLRPFLQRGLGVAQAAPRLVHARAESLAHHALGRGRAAVEKDRADDRLADIAENRALLAPARLRLALAEPHMGPDAPVAPRPRRRSPCAPARRAGATVRPRSRSGKAS